MRLDNVNVMNFENAIRGMRHPMESYGKIDSYMDNNEFVLGDNDRTLCKSLIRGGTEHRKFLRQILVSFDMTAPLYVWKEFDTYKVGTTANSTSTMHKIMSKPITLESFDIDDIDESEKFIYEDLVDKLECLRQEYLETKDKKIWKTLIRWLPCGWLQTRTITCNYEVLRNMYHQRKNHKLSEWHTFCDWIETLPYSEDLIVYNG